MKKTPLLPTFLLLTLGADAQVVTLLPQKPSFTEEVVLVYDAALGNGALKDCDCDIYRASSCTAAWGVQSDLLTGGACQRAGLALALE